MILGGGVAVCLLLSTHRAVIFAIAQLSCRMTYGSVYFIHLASEACLLYFIFVPTFHPAISRSTG